MTDIIFVLATTEAVSRTRERVRKFDVWQENVVIEFLLNEQGFTMHGNKAFYPQKTGDKSG